MLNIKYPIFQGGMAWIGTAELASAVSNAGGLGLIGAGHMPPDVLRAEIRKCKGWTDKPFGVNVMLMSPFVKEVMEVVVDEKVPVVTTGAGNPGEYLPALKEIVQVSGTTTGSFHKAVICVFPVISISSPGAPLSHRSNTLSTGAVKVQAGSVSFSPRSTTIWFIVPDPSPGWKTIAHGLSFH